MLLQPLPAYSGCTLALGYLALRTVKRTSPALVSVPFPLVIDVPLPSRQLGFGVACVGDGRPSVRVRLWEKVGRGTDSEMPQVWLCSLHLPTTPDLPHRDIFLVWPQALKPKGVRVFFSFLFHGS